MLPPQTPVIVPFAKKTQRPRDFWDFVASKHLEWLGVPFGVAVLGVYWNYLKAAENAASKVAQDVGPARLSVVFYGAVALTLVVLLAFLHKRLPPLPSNAPKEVTRAHRAVAQFVDQWKQLWTIWLLFYLAVGFQRFLGVFGTPDQIALAYSPLANVVVDAFNNAQTVALYLCYFVITWTSLRSIGDHGSYEEQIPSHAAWSVLIIVTLIDAGCALALHDREPLRQEIHTAFTVFSGFACGAAMAMVVGRLETKYAGGHPVLAFLFYLYALLQMTFLVFGGGPPLNKDLTVNIAAYEQDAVAAVALVLKVVLFIYVYWLVHSNRLLFYMARIHQLNETVEKDWEQFCRETTPDV